jgi:hypothetical protein
MVSPTVLEVRTGSSGAQLTRQQPIGDTWELRGEFGLVSHGTGRVEAALFCGPSGDQERRGFSLRFLTNGRGWTGVSLARGFGEDAFSKTTDFGQTTPFLVRMANHRLRVIANEVQWLADQPLPAGAEIDSGALLGLGSTGSGDRTVQFRNMELRTAGNGN